MKPEEIKEMFFYRSYPFAVKTKASFYIPVYREVTLNDIARHMNGAHTIGAYQSREDETCTWACIDFDSKAYDKVASKIYHKDYQRRKVYKDYVKSVKFEPTNKGFHVWFFFKFPIATESAYDFLVEVLAKENLEKGTNNKIDIFPRKPHLSGKRVGWLVKLPREMLIK